MNFIRKYLLTSVMIFQVISNGVIQFGMFEFFQEKHKMEVKDLIKNGIPDDRQVIFVFEKSAYENMQTGIDWKDSDEFRFDGEMYDILGTDVKGDSVYLYCLPDSDETGLYTILDRIIEKETEDSDEQAGLNNFVSHYYSGPEYSPTIKIPSAGEFNFGTGDRNLLDGEYLTNTPPPRS
jgi:hypothetical protein